MRGLDRRRSLGLVAILLGLAAGCGGGGGGGSTGTPGAENDNSGALQDFGEEYRMYSISMKHPPRKAEDIKIMKTMNPATLEAIDKGDLIVQWGASLPDFKEEPGQSSAPEILAYRKEVPEEGGYVLHLDRTVTKMTADEFKAAPKAAAK